MTDDRRDGQANRLTRVLRDVDDPVAELATPNSEAYVNRLEYDMDDVFNLTAYKVTPYGGSTTTTSYTTDAMNEYTAIGGTSPTYTDAGSLASDGTFTYKYDAHQHLIEVKQGATVIATYQYDALGLGRRIGKLVGGSATTRYVHAGQQAVEEYDGTGSGANLSRLFAFGDTIDQVVMMEAPDYGDVDSDSNTSEVLRFSFHAQLIGSVTQVTGPAQTVVESYLYDPYGKPTIKDAGGSTISASAIGNAYLFTGRQLDEETGLYYYRARHYSPELRRFIQRDPLEYIDGPNASAYVTGLPTARTDPMGLTAPGSGPVVVHGNEGRDCVNPTATPEEVAAYYETPECESWRLFQMYDKRLRMARFWYRSWQTGKRWAKQLRANNKIAQATQAEKDADADGEKAAMAMKDADDAWDRAKEAERREKAAKEKKEKRGR